MNRLLAVLAVLLVSLGLLSCGSSDDSTSSSASATAPATTANAENEALEDESFEQSPIMDDQLGDEHVRVAADPSGELRYFISEASSNVGKATIEFVNPTNTPHNVVVEDKNGKPFAETDVIRKGKTSTQVVFKKPIKYTYFCSVPGHRKAGMVGHITVYPDP